MLLLLAPSKTQDFETAPQTMQSSPLYFLEQTRKLARELKKLSVSDIEKLMKISTKIAETTNKSIHDFDTPLSMRNAKPALCAFTGDVYSGFDLDNYSEEDFLYAQDTIRILSGFYGALKPLDLMQPYRLEMQTKLSTENAKDLYEFWEETLTDYINKTGQETIVNLASAEYFSVLDATKLTAKVINPVFKERKDGKEKIVAIFAKRARGTMANWIVKNRIESIEDLKKFSESDYIFDASQSTESNLVFIRES